MGELIEECCGQLGWGTYAHSPMHAPIGKKRYSPNLFLKPRTNRRNGEHFYSVLTIKKKPFILYTIKLYILLYLKNKGGIEKVGTESFILVYSPHPTTNALE